MNKRKVFIKLLRTIVVILITICSLNAIIDPYFHYHKPFSFLAYPIEYQRYQNDGIIKHFDYDAIITGSSMCENFMTSELDELFGTNSIKIPESGATYKEINDELIKAFNTNNDIKVVIRCLDYSRLDDDKDIIRYEDNWYPKYLYDKNIFNDIKYLLNKSTLMSSASVIINTLNKKKTTTFDEYSNWALEYILGAKYISYTRSNIRIENDNYTLTNEDKKRINDNLYQNVIVLANENPNSDFYLFLSPYSIYYFDKLNMSGQLIKQLEIEKSAIETLVQYDNIHLFSFFDEEIICNLDNYRGINHYGEHINSYILQCMKESKNLITKDNYQEYCEKEREFFLNYDYDALFE